GGRASASTLPQGRWALRRAARRRRPARPTQSPLDALLAAVALVEGMLDLRDLADEVGDLDELRRRVPPGDEDVLVPRPVREHLDDLGGVDPAELHRVGEL